jgi:hypothetical protein
MDCKTLQERISDYIDGQLPDGERREIAAHLDACQACRAEVEAFQKTVDLVRSLPLVPAPEGFAERILQQALHVAPGSETFPAASPARFSAWLPVVRGVAAAAVLFLFAYVGYQVVEQKSDWQIPSSEVEIGSRLAPSKTAIQAEPPARAHLDLKSPVDRETSKEAKKTGSPGRSGYAGGPATGADGGESPSQELTDLEEVEQAKSKDSRKSDDSVKDAEAAAGKRPAGDGPGLAKEKGKEEFERLKSASPKSDAAAREPEQQGAEDSIGVLQKLKKNLCDGSGSSGTGPLPVTLVVSTRDLSGERKQVEALLESVRSGERAASGRRSLVGDLSDGKEGEPADGSKGRQAARGGWGQITGPLAGAPAPAKGEADAPGEGAPAPQEKDKNAEELAKQSDSDSGTPAGERVEKAQSVKPNAPEPPAAQPAKDLKRIEIRMTLGEYRTFKRELAETPSRFFEEPSTRMISHLRAELAMAKDARAVEAEEEGADTGAAAESAEKESADKKAGEGLRRAKAVAPNEPSVILVILFEEEAAPAPAPTPTPTPTPPPGAPDKKSAEQEKGK